MTQATIRYMLDGRWIDRKVAVTGQGQLSWSRPIFRHDIQNPIDEQIMLPVAEARRVAEILREDGHNDVALAVDAACDRSKLGYV